MSRKKGLSVEEKRSRMMELLFEKKDFFQLKELEKMGQKEKGVTSMSVKDIVQSLVDDDMIDTDRIGTSNYFWSFPSKALHTRKRKLADLTKQVEEAKKRKSHNEALQKDAKQGKDDTEKRQCVLKELKNMKDKKGKLTAELEQYKDLDPKTLQEKSRQTREAKEAINRWTDNVFSLKSWCKNKFGIEESAIDKNFGIPSDLDYVE
ncbi:meiotic nuclear division protein 1 homolog [Corticium candelabrum]|uniref:meiotic nuclear division protein 1 homolog n=1 Tax=Corticium candelabrum TaxID=121492 RepID=UPI002E26F6BD|nr:meiotic nuclear division protein 1 homolog [Corticium candelabrum]